MKLPWIFQRTVNLIILLLLGIGIISIWTFYYLKGIPSFNPNNAISIYGTIVQGMSALLSVSIAVIVFRIQSLENRKQTLEESTLNYVYQIIYWSYPEWSEHIERDIKNGSITTRYGTRVDWRIRDHEVACQQERLMHVIDVLEGIKNTIRKIRVDVFWSLLLLLTPILLSLYFMIVTDGLFQPLSYYAVSFVILLSTFGIVSLILTVMDSIASQKSQTVFL